MKDIKTPVDFDKISLIALLCAKIKSEYTDIPYATEIYELLSKDEKKFNGIDLTPLEYEHSNLSLRVVSTLEGRHLSINDAIKDSGPILELSAGLSSRGLEFSGRDHYIETDLPAMTALKKKIVNQIIIENSSYQILPLNPLNLSELLLFGKRFQGEYGKKPPTIINEGLLMYLSTNEQEQLRDNLTLFLGKYFPQSSWITTDFSSRPIEGMGEVSNLMKKIEKETGREFNRFNDDEEVHKFLFEGDLKGEALPNHHLIDRLSCLKKLKITREEAAKVSDMYKAWRITLK